MKKRLAAIISKTNKSEIAPLAIGVIGWLNEQGFEVLADEQTAEYAGLQAWVERDALADAKPEFLVVLGGDGTLLNGARAVARAGVPILGVNLGTLGFLAEVTLPELYRTLTAVVQGQCGSERRSMIACRVMRDGKVIAAFDALNDIVVNQGAVARMGDFDVAIDGVMISNYKADGVIVATPTGSTAYSLAAGGPILAPNVDAFVITPVSPHALTNRPLVVRDNNTLRITVNNAREQSHLTIDGQVHVPLDQEDHVVCSLSPYQVVLLRLGENKFFDALRTKLKWGER